MKKGISLLVLIITIIVIIILSSTVILSIVQNNPIGQANEATFKSDLDAVKSDYSMYIVGQYAENKSYDPLKLNSNELSVEYDGINLPGKTIKDVIPILATTDKYNGQFEVVNGELIYLGTDRTKKRWAQDVNVEVIDADRLDASISSTATLPVSAGTDVLVTIKYSSNASIDRINLADKLELLNENNVVVTNQPIFEIGIPSGTTSDTLRSVDVTLKTDVLVEGSYKLKLKPLSIYNIYDVTITKEIITNVLFEIDNTPPENPIMSVDTTGWTNGDVTVSITYPSDSISNEYSLDGTNWTTYTLPIVINKNNTTVYARGTDISGNQSSQSTITIANIDKESPTVEYAPNGGENLQTISTKVTLTDAGVSNVKSDSLQYVWDTQNSTQPIAGWNTFTNGNTIERAGDNAYYLWIKASDNAENSVVSKSNLFEGDITPPENPTMSANPTGWTNGNVTVTITYSADSNKKEYSIDGTTWSTYTAPVVVSVNNTTVYARGTDASGNQSGQSTVTIVNIDKTAPSIPVANFNGYTPGTWSSSDITLNLSSTDIGSGIGKYQWSTDRITWNDFYSSWLYNYDTAQTTCFRTVDNAGNTSAATAYYNILRDRTAPTYSSYELKNVTSSGYDVYVYGVGDAGSGINRVQFPSWTVYNDQDDIQSNWVYNASATGQNLGGGTWYYRVNVTDHNNESGIYSTHVYLYDNLGNHVGLSSQPTVNVPTAISYGNAIQNTYTNLYLSNNSKVPFTNNYHNYDTLYNGNFYLTSGLIETLKSMGSENIAVTRQCVDGSYSGYIYSGENTVAFTRNSNLNRWMCVSFWAGGMTTGVYISNFRLKFADGSVLNLEQAVSNGYIEPLVVMASGAHSAYYSGLWTNFIGLKDGGLTSTQNYPSGNIMFKIKNKSPLSTVMIYSSKAFNTNYDGINVFECIPTTELSINPF